MHAFVFVVIPLMTKLICSEIVSFSRSHFDKNVF